MRIAWNAIDDLVQERNAEFDGSRTGTRKQAVIESTTPAETSAIAIERQTGT